MEYVHTTQGLLNTCRSIRSLEYFSVISRSLKRHFVIFLRVVIKTRVDFPYSRSERLHFDSKSLLYDNYRHFDWKFSIVFIILGKKTNGMRIVFEIHGVHLKCDFCGFYCVFPRPFDEEYFGSGTQINLKRKFACSPDTGHACHAFG